MDTAVTNPDQIMAALLAKRDFRALASTANAVVQKNPQAAVAIRYLGIATLFGGGDGWPIIARAAALGDSEANLWLNVVSEMSAFPKGTVSVHDLITQVGLVRLRRSVHMEYPTEVHIETLALCNAKCTFCPYPTMERQGDRMSDALIDKIIDDLKAIPAHVKFTISPFKVNEPLLDKRFFAVCEKINNELPNAQLRLFTNGSPLTEKIIEKIAAIRNVKHLWISLNSADAVEYEKLMALPFKTTTAKLDMLHKRVKAGYPHPVVLSRVTDGSAADTAFHQFVVTRYPLFQPFFITGQNWTGQVDGMPQHKQVATACSRWYEVSIMASGKVALCCMDGEGKHVIGDVNKQSVLEVYNSPGYRKMRQFSFSRLAAASPCDTCTY